MSTCNPVKVSMIPEFELQNLVKMNKEKSSMRPTINNWLDASSI